MPNEEKTTRPEISFLPPLKMVLIFFDREAKKREQQRKIAAEPKGSNEKAIAKLIEKLNEKDG